MERKCPKCGGKLGIFDLKPNCPHCGCSIMYYDMDKRLEEDSVKADADNGCAASGAGTAGRIPAGRTGRPKASFRLFPLVISRF